MALQGPPADRQGFPASAEATAVPKAFFTQVLPRITRAEEIIVTLYFFFAHTGVAQGQGRRRPPFLTAGELAADTILLQALANFSADPQAGLAEGLALAVQRGTLLRLEGEGDGRQEVYLLNTAANRRALARLPGGTARLGKTAIPEPLPSGEAAPRPNIFALYEENIGAVTPLIAEELQDAEAHYPWPWIVAAFREAAAMNKRSWRYIQAILQRWEAEGPNYEALGRDIEADAGPKRPLSGRYRYLVRR